jgi:hypothetical protein
MERRSVLSLITLVSDILHDPHQTLFVGCTFPLQSSQPCNYPVLVNQPTTFCAAHADLPNYVRPSGKHLTVEEDPSLLGKRAASDASLYQLEELLQPPPSADSLFPY